VFQDAQEQIPTWDEIEKMHFNDAGYMWFLSVFLKHGVGAKNWNQCHLRQVVSKYCTPSTEAYVLLVLQNNYNRWMDRAENPMKPNKELAESLFTNGGISRRGGNASSKRGGGWSSDGIKRFNELVLLVKNDRKTRLDFELALQAKMTEENHVKSWEYRSIENHEAEEEEEVIAVNDFDDLEENDDGKDNGENMLATAV
jgi:hypothetical protein